MKIEKYMVRLISQAPSLNKLSNTVFTFIEVSKGGILEDRAKSKPYMLSTQKSLSESINNFHVCTVVKVQSKSEI